MTKHDIAELLPFYLNGTLDDADRARVEAELAACDDCSHELRELQTLGVSLQARADAAPPMPDHLFDDVMARIAVSAPASAATATKLHASWWSIPARYATAAALVVGFGAAAAAAYHAHEADIARSTQGTVVAAATDALSVFRARDENKAVQPKTKVGAEALNPAAGAPAQTTEAQAAPTVAKHHRLAKKARLELLVRNVEATLKQVRSVIGSAGGEIVSLADANPRTDESVHEAHADVEIPSDRLEATLDRLGVLGTVQNRAIDAEDVDAAIVDEEARLRNLRREEDDLRKLMDKGGKVSDILEVQQNLSEVRGQIEQLAAQHANDLHRVATSTISIALTEDRPNPTPAKPGPTARIDGAWHGGLNALADTVVSLLSVIVWCVAYAPIPLGLAGITYAATRLLKRRTASA
jgi:anti-sigma factor RsiW